MGNTDIGERPQLRGNLLGRSCQRRLVTGAESANPRYAETPSEPGKSTVTVVVRVSVAGSRPTSTQAAFTRARDSAACAAYCRSIRSTVGVPRREPQRPCPGRPNQNRRTLGRGPRGRSSQPWI